jgi:tetratricopeptide (TPR) repeat protein
VHFGYGYALWRRLKFDDAEREFRSELANNQEHPLALAYLGDTEMRRKSLDDAVLHLEHAVRIQPSIEIAHLDLGIVYEGQGRKEDALSEFKKAEELNPRDSAIHWRLGRFYQSMGRKVEAKGEFEKAQSLLQATQLSLREQIHQGDAKPEGQNADIEPK